LVFGFGLVLSYSALSTQLAFALLEMSVFESLHNGLGVKKLDERSPEKASSTSGEASVFLNSELEVLATCCCAGT